MNLAIAASWLSDNFLFCFVLYFFRFLAVQNENDWQKTKQSDCFCEISTWSKSILFILRCDDKWHQMSLLLSLSPHLPLRQHKHTRSVNECTIFAHIKPHYLYLYFGFIILIFFFLSFHSILKRLTTIAIIMKSNQNNKQQWREERRKKSVACI